MKQVLALGVVGLVAVVVTVGVAAADPSETVRSFRFLPRRSTVHVTGGFAGVDWKLHARGSFDFVTKFDPPGVLTVMPYAGFENVDASLFNPKSMAPKDMPGWDLDDTLNLSELAGTRRAINLYTFRGREGQDQPIELKVTTRGPLMHIVGANKPGCCDFFEYEINMLALRGPYADFDLDGKVDKSDLQVVMANIGMLSDATFEQGDSDGDADVDGDDFLAWQRQVGTSISLAEFDGASFDGGTVPEPSAFWLALVAAAASFRRRTCRC